MYLYFYRISPDLIETQFVKFLKLNPNFRILMFDSDINNVENMDNTKISQQSKFDHNLSNVIAGSETHWLSHLAGHRCSQIVHNF